MRGIFVFLWNVSVSLSSVSMDDFRNACEELAEIIIIAVSNRGDSGVLFLQHTIDSLMIEMMAIDSEFLTHLQ